MENRRSRVEADEEIDGGGEPGKLNQSSWIFVKPGMHCSCMVLTFYWDFTTALNLVLQTRRPLSRF